MAKLSITGKELRKLGYPEGPVISVVINTMEKNYKHTSKEDAMNILKDVLAQPEGFTDDEVLGNIAKLLIPKAVTESDEIPLKAAGVHFSIFGSEHIEEGALMQMHAASKLPVAVGGALMPDAHSGYGLPIGGVLATENE